MATQKQYEAAKKNIRKAHAKWENMSHRQHTMTQPEGRKREKPGEAGGGKYYRIVVRSKNQFTSFRYHDVGEKGGDLIRLAGKRQSGSWDTQAWLVNKNSAHIEDDRLVADVEDVRELLDTLGSEPKHMKGDLFEAKDRPNVPEYKKPTTAQQQARMENIEKAQQARWTGSAGGKAQHNNKK